MGDSIAELSRPAHSLKEKFKAKVRKASGRKRKNTERPAKYHNWVTPFLFKQIEDAKITSGGPTWSTWAIISELQKKDFATFQGLSRTMINGWIDQSQNKPCWSEKTLERVKKGNQPGHINGGQKGVLVRDFNQQYRANKLKRHTGKLSRCCIHHQITTQRHSRKRSPSFHHYRKSNNASNNHVISARDFGAKL